MKKILIAAIVFGSQAIGALAQSFQPAELQRWQQLASEVTIIRDRWGIPHIYGPTDAAVVFGALYAQCEDDFARVEENYLDACGRLAEVKGEAALYQDLRTRLFQDTLQAIRLYTKAPAKLRVLLDAFAGGVNYYLHTHPAVKPQVLRRFQPWMPLLFSEGSIGGNLSMVALPRLQAFYSGKLTSGGPDPWERAEWEPTGSNGFAIAPSRSASGHALLLINPHTSFYFRAELQMVSAEGLNAYGAATWGQFFIYQGFNEHCGWMHTSSDADVMDEYLETVEQRAGQFFYRYEGKWRPVTTRQIEIACRVGDKLEKRVFPAYFTHHGPIVGEASGKWLAQSMMNRPIEALLQSFYRTKARGYGDYRKAMQYRANASNNTVFADKLGNIAYWHGNFMPRRDPAIDWSQPVDGSTAATAWRGLHRVEETVALLNPATGWIQNCNATPFTAAGAASPRAQDYPNYMAPDAENFRGINAVRVLERNNRYTLDDLIKAAYDPHLVAFEDLIPALVKAYAEVPKADPQLQGAINLLQAWDANLDTASVAGTVAILWGEKLLRLARTMALQPADFENLPLNQLAIQKTLPSEKIRLLEETLQELRDQFGRWEVPWGEINRFQRLTGAITPIFDDAAPSFPVGFTSSSWGSLPAFGARTYPGTKKRYGSVGNSFVAVVEFGPQIRAKAIVTGGQSANPQSAHFNDQSRRYATGQFRDVYFYRAAVEQVAEATYHPGEK